MATLKERVDKHDREIAAIRKLIHTGMTLFVKAEEEHKIFRRSYVNSAPLSVRPIDNCKPLSAHFSAAATATRKTKGAADAP